MADNYSQNTTSTGKSTSGPHKSDWMNKLDPRVDSKKTYEDHDVAATGGSDSMTGTTTTTNTSHGMGNSGVSPSTAGQYNSHPSAMEREAQPQGTFDHRGTVGGGSQAVGGGTIPRTTTQTAGSNVHADSTRRTTADPHRSDLANKLDPRVESDVSGGNRRDYASSGAGVGVGAGSGTGQAPVPSMINQGDSRVQGVGGVSARQQNPIGSGATSGTSGMAGHGGATTTVHPEVYQGGTYGTSAGGADPDTHRTVTGGTHSGGLSSEHHHGTGTHQGTSSGSGLKHGVKSAAAGIHVSFAPDSLNQPPR